MKLIYDGRAIETRPTPEIRYIRRLQAAKVARLQKAIDVAEDRLCNAERALARCDREILKRGKEKAA